MLANDQRTRAMSITSRPHWLGGDARWTRKTRLDALRSISDFKLPQATELVLRAASHLRLPPAATRISSGSCTALAAYSSHPCKGFTHISEDSSEIAFLLVENYQLTASSSGNSRALEKSRSALIAVASTSVLYPRL
ncbi:hypothetical protein KC363_g105 [Hortaea werneckii]|nr:hypothetical protein KC363_g105 [Hortaea werneckii]